MLALSKQAEDLHARLDAWRKAQTDSVGDVPVDA